MSELRDMMHEMLGVSRQDTTITFDAEVISVSEDNRTCEIVMVGGKSANHLTARLMASVDDGAFYIPKVGSNVVVIASEFVEPYVSLYSAIEKITWLGGEYGGVPIVIDPNNPKIGLVPRITNIEQLLNHLIINFNAHIHPLSSGTSSPTTLQEPGRIAPLTSESDISHPNITH